MSENPINSDESMPGFRFVEQPELHETGNARAAKIPASVRSKQKLLRILAGQLQFPAYFGNNWDALEECLRDLSWLAAGNIEICHLDLPLSPGGQDQRTYLQILQSAAAFWTKNGERRFEAVFPTAVQAELRSIRA